MKRIALLFLLIAPVFSFAQNFESQWKEVDRLISIKNYKETQPIIASIKSQAKVTGNSPEWIRAVMAEHHALTINRAVDDRFYDVKQHLLSHITDANPVELSVLQNIYASFLSQYVHYSRVETSPGYLSWDQEKRIGHIDSIFKASLDAKPLLVSQIIEQWKTLLTDLKNQSLAPTVYHLLAHNYLEFLDTYDQKESKDKSIIQDLQNINRENNYTDAYTYLAFRPYAHIGAWRMLEQEKEIRQLLDEQYSDYNAHILLLLANAYRTRGDNKKAVENLDTALATYPNSPWILGVRELREELTRQSVSLNISRFSPSDQYIPIKLNALNTDKAFIRVYKTTSTPKDFRPYKTFRTKYDTLTNHVTIDAQWVYEDQVQLQEFDDYKQHITNYKINPLPYGNYKVLVANNPDFKDNGQELDVAEADFIVSDIFISPTIDEESDYGYTYRTVLINRKTGSPYQNKKIELYEEDDKDKLHRVSSINTNTHGEFTYVSHYEKDREDLDDLYIYLLEENQLIELVDVGNIPEHIGDEEKEKETQNKGIILIDRSIYRPGQEVFFKAILYTDDRLKGKIIPNHDVEIVLKDANHQPLDTIRLTSNSFGSVQGIFRIPQRTLNGRFHMELLEEGKHRIASHSFSVEEYKRPTFKISFDENKNTYTKQDTATFTGTVESLSGAKLSHIPVKYTVHFYAQNKYYQRVSYLDDTLTTDEDGKFSFQIQFGDAVLRDEQNISLQFEAEAINENGEIQTASGNYRYSDKPLNISIISPAQVIDEEWKNVIIKTSNPNGHPLPAKGIIHIYRYTDPNIIQAPRKAFSFHADYHVLDTVDYEHYFPWYFDKLDLMNERPKTLVGTYTFDSSDTDTVRFDDSSYPYGSYHIEAYSIQATDTIRAEQGLQVLSKSSRKISDKDFLVVRLDQPNYTIGDQVNIHLQTDFKQASGVYIWQVQGHTKRQAKFVPFRDGQATYTHEVSEQDIRHNTWFEILMVQENKIVSQQTRIPIIRTDKALSFHVRTFRDKITPGQTETWSFTINNKENIVQAEVLASMYDTALDQFRQHHFPSAFTISVPYRWAFVRSGWNISEFNHQIQSRTPFAKVWPRMTQTSNLPSLKSYGLFDGDLLYFPQSRVFHSVAYESASMEEVVVVSHGLAGAVPGVAVRGAASLYDELKDPDLKREIEELKSKSANGELLPNDTQNVLNQVQARTNLQETAFFYPTLLTDKEGNITFEFESPEALTKWKLMLFAHTKDLKAGTASFFTQTQKQLMVRPNLPRFLREGDEIVIKSQVQNLSDEALNGTAQLEVIDPQTNKVISSSFFGDDGLRGFSVDAKGNTVVSWTLQIPQNYPTVQIRVVGATQEFSDGEIHELPILPNRLLITDTEKIILDPEQHKDYVIPTAGKDNLHLKVQVQSNPILEIIAALDYLKNYPYECNEQTASKWYGHMMLQYIQKHYPAISTFFNNIALDDTRSKLEENNSLSELLNEEMPWLRQIQNDKDKIQSLARLFKSDLSSDIRSLEQKLQKTQMENGSFSWFDGGKPNTHISIRLLEVFGKVAKLDKSLLSNDVWAISQKLIGFLDQDTSIYKEKAPTGLVLDYLYARTLWNGEHVLPAEKTEQLRKYIDLSASYTAKQPAGLAAKAWLVNAFYDYRIASIEVKNRIEQEVIYDKEQGMYWESHERPYNSMSLQSYMVEAYRELDPSKLDQITQWIYWNKQQNHWRTTWNTVDAVYALLLANNPEDFNLDNTVTIHIDQQLAQTDDKVLGQVSTELLAEELGRDKTISVSNNNNRRVYGGIYHQYFVPLEEVTSAQRELSIEKKFLVEKEGEWVESSSFKSGDKIKVQLIVVSNENLHYVHLKDSRPAGLEPVYRPSGYQWWQGYYFTIKDASTNYFFDYLSKGRHVYEYEVKTNNSGVFNSGIAQIECMYEPTINARSANSKVEIEE